MELNIISFNEARDRVNKARAFKESKFNEIIEEINMAVKNISGNGECQYSTQMEFQYADKIRTFFETSPNHKQYSVIVHGVVGGRSKRIDASPQLRNVDVTLSWEKDD